MLGDTKSVQKEINQLSGVLDRTFAVTDELIFRDAKRDENVRKSYKFLAALHEVSTEINHTSIVNYLHVITVPVDNSFLQRFAIAGCNQKCHLK